MKNDTRKAQKSKDSSQIHIEKLDFKKVIHENKGFTTYLNIIIQNIRDPLSLAIWVYLSSLPPNWNINKAHLRSHFDIGRDRLKKSLSNLNKLNLIQFIQQRNSDGTLGDVEILVKAGHEFNHDTEIQYCGKKPSKQRVSTAILKNRRTVNQACGKQPLQKKQNTKERKSFKKEIKKSFLEKNSAKHNFADSMNQMACEKRHIEQHEERKRGELTPVAEEHMAKIKKLTAFKRIN